MMGAKCAIIIQSQITCYLSGRDGRGSVFSWQSISLALITPSHVNLLKATYWWGGQNVESPVALNVEVRIMIPDLRFVRK